jgi:hypothetical protein
MYLTPRAPSESLARWDAHTDRLDRLGEQAHAGK